MKTLLSSLQWNGRLLAVRLVLCGVLALAAVGSGPAAWSADAAASEKEADAAWEAVEAAAKPPQPPEAWRTQRPSAEEIAEWRAAQGKLAGEAAGKAREFVQKYPQHSRAGDARQQEFQLLRVAVRLGSTNYQARLEEAERVLLTDAGTPEDARFEIRTEQVQRAAMQKQPGGMPAMMAEFEKGVRELLKEFPKREEPYGMLLEVANNAEPEAGRKLAQEIVAGAPEPVKAEAQALLKKLDLLGKPFALSFKAVDGREVDVATMKGKVVLIDFWATWCGPCVAELPNVKAAYDKLHPKGFEIVGISFDQEQQALEKFVKEKEMSWAQYFDGQGWQNKHGREYGINSIPTMWLVDKKGNLRDMNAREGLASKVEKLLAE